MVVGLVGYNLFFQARIAPVICFTIDHLTGLTSEIFGAPSTSKIPEKKADVVSLVRAEGSSLERLGCQKRFFMWDDFEPPQVVKHILLFLKLLTPKNEDNVQRVSQQT